MLSRALAFCARLSISCGHYSNSDHEPEVFFWSITLLARYFCGTCPRSWPTSI